MVHQLEDIWSYNNSISNVIIWISPPTLLILLWITPAPYGRYHNFKWFSSFLDIPGRLGWIVMESPNIWVPLIVYMLYPCQYVTNLPNKVLFLLYIIHYLYRSVIYPFLQKQKPHTTITVLAAFVYCTFNAYIQSTALLVLYKYDDDLFLNSRFIAGVSLWAFGFLTNIYSDYLLRNLRKPGETGYKIPQGYMFEYVSAANYFGEIVEWCGFALVCWNRAALSFMVFTLCNLIPRGIKHHQYYLEKFDNYPKNRRAVIPFLV